MEHTDPFRMILITIIKYLGDSYSAPCPMLRALYVSLQLSLTAPYEKQMLLCSFHKFKKLRPDGVKGSTQMTQLEASDAEFHPGARLNKARTQRDVRSPVCAAAKT